MQRLIAELTPAAALETQAGTMRQAWATPSPPSLGSPRFQSFRQGSHGQLRASLGLPGHLRGVGPANGTRPVGLGGTSTCTSDPTHTCPLSHLALLRSLVGMWPGVQPSSLRTRGHPEWLGPRYLQPLVNTLGVELMAAGEDSEQLPHFKVAEADNAPEGSTKHHLHAGWW